MVDRTITPINVFRKGLELHHYANTAYPLDGSKVWREYKVRDNVDEEVRKHWASVSKLGLYAHIPFCERRCKYCEYSVVSGEESLLKDEYVNALEKELGMYSEVIGGKEVVGLDIGGGTPTTISVRDIERVIKCTTKYVKLDENFSISIETTPKIAATELDKIRGIRQLGVDRISMGMQTLDSKLLAHFGRDGQPEMLKRAAENIKTAGFTRFNIDLMYGFADQKIDSFLHTLRFAIALNPEYVTLYRNRYKGTSLEEERKKVTLNQVNEQYDVAYNLLIAEGFESNIGKNTFSKIKGDPGTSAYLTKRVVEGMPYIGFGLGAQNLADGAIYYNLGAASKRMDAYRKAISEGHFPVQDFYVLPEEEIMAKVIAVSFYFGQIDKIAFESKFGVTLEEKFLEEVAFLKNNDLMQDSGRFFALTKKGKDVLNGILPLFYSEKSKLNLISRRC